MNDERVVASEVNDETVRRLVPASRTTGRGHEEGLASAADSPTDGLSRATLPRWRANRSRCSSMTPSSRRWREGAR